MHNLPDFILIAVILLNFFYWAQAVWAPACRRWRCRGRSYRSCPHS